MVCSFLYGSHRSCIFLSSDKQLRQIPIRRRRHSSRAMDASHLAHANPTTLCPSLLSHYLWCLLRRYCHLQITRRPSANLNHGPVRRIPHLAYLLRHDVDSFPTSRIPRSGRPMVSRRHHIWYRSSASVWTYATQSNITSMPILLYTVRSPERMMVYKYWNSITVRVRCYVSIQLLSTLTYSPRQREDLEFSVGSKVAVWKSKISC